MKSTPSKPKVMVGIPSLKMMPTEFVISLLSIRTPGVTLQIEGNSLTHFARGSLLKKAIEGTYDYLLMVDSDMQFEPDVISRMVDVITQNNLDYVSSLCFKRCYPTEPVICKSIDYAFDPEKGVIKHDVVLWTDYPKDTLFECGGSGFGMVIIKVEKMVRMIEKFKMSPFEPLPGLGEDYSFCLRFHECGFKMYCDSRIKIGHIGNHIFCEETYLGQLAAEARKARGE